MSEASISSTAAVRRFAQLAEDHHGDLTALDQRAGDGDFGDNLRGGLRDVLTALDAAGPGTDNGNAFAVAGEVFLDTVGGTSGPLLGLLFQSIGAAGSGEAVGSGDLAEGVAAGMAAIQRVGEAVVGDRTLVDALAPAVDALASGDLHAGADAAYRGARSTSGLRARHGRASYVGERAVGAPDPGAAGVALLFRALAEVGQPDAEWDWTTADLVAAD